MKKDPLKEMSFVYASILQVVEKEESHFDQSEGSGIHLEKGQGFESSVQEWMVLQKKTSI